jgi:simple sugar transport system permease protein
MFNVGLEGMMLVSAFFSVYTANATGSLILGLAAGVGINMLLGLVMVFIAEKLKADIFVVGIAANLLATGLTTFLGMWLLGLKGTLLFEKAPRLKLLDIPLLGDIPLLNGLLNGHHLIDYLGIVLAIVLYLVVFYTTYGRHLRAVGINPWVANARGISVDKVRYSSYLWCGFLCGLAGASLSLPIGAFMGGPIGMTNGRGWLAMAVVIVGQDNPLRILLVSWAFGAISALADIIQATTNFSPRLMMAFPFIGALLITALYSAGKGWGRSAANNG